MTYDEYYVSEFEKKKYGDQIGKSMMQMKHKILSKMVNEDGVSILDVGAGTGWMSIHLIKEKNVNAIAFDGSSEMLEFARNRARSQKMKLHAIKGDAHHLPFRNQSFAYVISFRTLMHLKNPKLAISEMCRVSNQVILDFPSKTSISGILESFMNLPLFENFIYNLKRNPKRGSKLSKLFSAGKSFFLFRIRNEFKNNRFIITETQRCWTLPLFFHRALKSIKFSQRLESVFRESNITFFLGTPTIIKAKRMEL